MGKNFFYYIFIVLFLFQIDVLGQCTITSTNGWNAIVTLTPTAVVPEFIDCPWYYHYEVRFSYSVTFSGSSTSRSIGCNVYLNCTGGTGGQPYRSLGTFTVDASGTLTTGNNARQYSASGGAYNYGSNPSCTTITVANANCTSFKLDYWGNGVTGGSCTTSVLPIELINFNAQIKNSTTILTWQTATETNNEFFTIEKSIDGTHFEKLQILPGAGNSNKPLNYQFIDDNPIKGISYYRLKQTDYNGQSEIFPIVAVNYQPLFNDQLNVFPNPASGNISLSVTGIESEKANIILRDLPGRICYKEMINLENSQILSLDLKSIVQGIYFLSVETDHFKMTKKIILK